MTSPREAPEVFIRNVQRQFADAELEANKSEFEIYFDTVDVSDAVVGIQSLYARGGFNEKKFDSPRTLVQTLFSAGWIGPVKMLPPHQAEFLSGLEMGLKVGNADDFAAEERDFYGRLSLPQGRDHVTRMITRDALPQYVFKAVELVSDYWRGRLARWQTRRLISAGAPRQPFGEIIASPHFRKLRAVFDRLRVDETSHRNFADAAALAALAHMVEDFNAGRSSTVPLFFAKPLFARVVADADMGQLFTYGNGDGAGRSILCDAEYFILRSILYPARTAFESESKYLEYFERTKLAQARANLDDIVKSASTASTKALADTKVDGKKLSEELQSVQNFAFFEWVWLPAFNGRDILDDESLSALVKTLKSRQVREVASVEFNKLQHELLKGAHNFRVIQRLWERVNLGVNRVKQQFAQGHFHGDPIVPSGLIRFSLPARAQRFVRKVLPTLLEHDPSEELNATGLIFGVFQQASEPSEADLPRIATAAALLWLGELYEEIVKLLEKHRSLHHSLGMMYAAAAAESKNATLRAEALAGLEKTYQAAPAHARPELAIGLAYVTYHVAVNEGLTPSWQEIKESESEPSGNGEATVTPAPGVEKLVKNAIQYAREGTTIGDPARAAYALNLVVYYSVALGIDDAHLRALAVRLVQFKNQPFWQFRYDDTLARYYYLLWLHAQSPETKKRFISLALQHIDDAVRAVNTNAEVNLFRSTLTMIALADSAL